MISRSTLYRRIAESGLPIQGYTDITDANLDSIIRELKQMHPNDGEVMMAAHLRTRTICIPRARLRASIHHIDPHASENRRAAIRRRTYSVPSPNSVWHLDGNHILIRWRFVVHGGIDGYSRLRSM